MISWFEKHSKISWTITILIAIMIFYLSTLTFIGVAPTKGFGWKTTAYHFFAFFFFAFFLLISLIQGDIKKNKSLALGIFIAILYGISDEIHQLFVPNRFFSISDILTNSAGILFASFFYLYYLKPHP